MNPITDEMINTELHIPGYNIVLSNTWKQFDVARLIVYVRSDINYKIVSTQINIKDLPIITMKAKKGGDKDTLISFFYREFMGGISGLRTREALRETDKDVELLERAR